MEIILAAFLIIIIAGIWAWKWLNSIDYTIGDFIDYDISDGDLLTPPWVEETETETGFN